MMRLLLTVAVLALGSKLSDSVDVKTNGNVADDAYIESDVRATVDGEPEIVVNGRIERNAERCLHMSGDDLRLHVKLDGTHHVNFALLYVTGVTDNGLFKDRLEEMKVYVDKEKVCAADLPGVGQQRNTAIIEVVCSQPIRGSQVTISLPGDNRDLRLCEVEVYDKTCDCLEGCQTVQGFCFSPCVRSSWCRRENLALSKPTRSSVLIDVSGPNSLVVNGNTGTTFISRRMTSDEKEQNCVRTSRPRSSSTSNVTGLWSVDLQKDAAIRGVVIYRANAEQVWEKESVTQIRVDDKLCAEYSTETHEPEEALRGRLVVKCAEVIRGRTVHIARLKTSRTSSPAPLELCEVQVWSCRVGWYGDQCYRCGRCEGGRYKCDTITGHCPGGCSAGWFHSTCRKPCRASCLDRVCHQDTGHCKQCPPNRDLPFCSECTKGWFGKSCNQTCGECSNGKNCNPVTGHCEQGCASGWLPPFCVEHAEQETSSSTTSFSTTSLTAAGNSVDENEEEEGGDDDEVAMAAGTAVGAVTVVVIICVILFVCYRRRGLNPKTQSAELPSERGKSEAVKTESFSYAEAMSTDMNNSDVTHSTERGALYDVNSDVNCYDSLDVMTYENMDNDDHVYVTPVFKRGDSVTSNASGAYVNMGYCSFDAKTD